MTNHFQTSRLQWRIACGVAGFAPACGGATAQEVAYPTRAVQIVVPYSAGSTPDILARLLGPKLSERWKVSVIADNRPGATGAIGIAFVAKAAPDGHTLMFVPTSFTMIPAVYGKLPFDPVKSFAIVLLASPQVVFAQVCPSKPVRVIVTFPPGGSIDITSRIVFDKMTEQMGEQFVIENRAGASGSIGAAYVAASAPDGYTLMAQSASHIANAFVYPKLPYDTLNDFIGVTTLARQVGVLIVHPSMPVKSTKDFTALAKKRPGAINYGSGGNGSFLQVAMALFTSMTGTNMVHVPFRGGGPAAIALMSGEIQAIISTLGSVIPFINAKQVRAIGVTSKERITLLPDVPTLGESVPGYEYTAWVGCLVPAGTPKDIVDKLNREFMKALGDPATAQNLSKLTLDPMYMTPDEFALRLRSDYEKYGKLIKRTGARIR